MIVYSYNYFCEQSLTVQEREQTERVENLKREVKNAKPDPKHQSKLEKDIEVFEKGKKKDMVVFEIQNQWTSITYKIIENPNHRTFSQTPVKFSGNGDIKMYKVLFDLNYIYTIFVKILY